MQDEIEVPYTPPETKDAAEAYVIAEYPEEAVVSNRGIAYLAFIAGAKWNEEHRWREGWKLLNRSTESGDKDE